MKKMTTNTDKVARNGLIPHLIILPALVILILLTSLTLAPTARSAGPPLPPIWAVGDTPIADGLINATDVRVKSTAINEGVWYAFGPPGGSWRHDCPFGPHMGLALSLTGGQPWYITDVDSEVNWRHRERLPNLYVWSDSNWISYADLIPSEWGAGSPHPRAIFQAPAGATTLYFRIPDTNGSNNYDPWGCPENYWDRRIGWALWPVYFDTTPPVTTATLNGTLGGGGWYISPVTMTLTANDPANPPEPTGGVAQTYLDGAAYGGPAIISSEGTTSHAYYSVDMSGNIEPDNSVDVKIDTNAPTITPSAGGFVSGMATASGTASDGAGSGVGSIEVSTDGGVTWNPATGSNNWTYDWDTTGFPDGPHTLLVRGSDIAGNLKAPVNLDVVIDNGGPNTSVDSPATGTPVGGITTISGTANDGTGSGVDYVELSFDGGATWDTVSGTNNWTYDWDTSGLPNGPATVLARAVDQLGNTGTPFTLIPEVDATGPSATISTPTPGQVVGGITTISGTADDGAGIGVDYVEVSFDGGATWATASGGQNWTLNWNTSGTPDGPLTILARAVDDFGNEGTPASVDVVVDSSGPATTITNPADGQTVSGVTTINGTADDGAGVGVAQVQVSFDGGTTWFSASGAGNWSYDWNTAGLPDGVYTVLARGIDLAGNAGPPDSAGNIMVDNGQPTVHISSPADNAIVSGTTPISGTASDPGGVDYVEVSFDGGTTWMTANGADNWQVDWDTSSTPDGVVTVMARAHDLTGNVSALDSINVIVDNTPPNAQITSPTDGETVSGVVTINGTANDGLGTGISRVEVSTDGGTTWYAATGTDNWSFEWDTAGLIPNGQYTILARAIDRAGLTGVPDQIVARVDNSLPVTPTPIPQPPSDATLAIVVKPEIGAIGDVFAWTVEASNSGSASIGTPTGIALGAFNKQSGIFWAPAISTTLAEPTADLVIEVHIPATLDITEVSTVSGGYRVEGQMVTYTVRGIPGNERVHIVINTTTNETTEAGQDMCGTANFAGSSEQVSDCIQVWPTMLPPTGGNPISPRGDLTLAGIIALTAFPILVTAQKTKR